MKNIKTFKQRTVINGTVVNGVILTTIPTKNLTKPLTSTLGKISLTISAITLLCATTSYADTATASQHLRVIIPKIALLDTSNTHTTLQLTFDPVIEAGNNFTTATANSHYDVSSNIDTLRLYARINKNLESNYNMTLKVNARSTTLKTLTTTNKRIINIKEQKTTGKKLNYVASPTFPNRMIPYGDIDVTVIYTLVEP